MKTEVMVEEGGMVLARHTMAGGGELLARAGDAFHLRGGHIADVLADAVLVSPRFRS